MALGEPGGGEMIAPSKIDEVIEYAATENCDETIVEQAIEEFAQLRAELDEARKVIEICHEVGCQTATDYLASHPKDGVK